MENIDRTDGGMTLEVGCGVGAFCQKLSEKGEDVVGLDFDRNAISIAKGLTKMVSFVLGDAQRLPFRDGKFGLVICSETLEHASDLKAFCEVVRITQK